MKTLLTLSIVQQNQRVLLGLKKRGFGAGRWNGFGGKLEGEETIEAAAIRELYEEAGVSARSVDKLGILEFSFANEPKVLEMHIFRVTEFSGELLESEEMKPRWFNVDKIPFPDMWSDDIYWFPHFLAGKKFRGRFHFDRPSDAKYQAKILEMELNEAEEL